MPHPDAALPALLPDLADLADVAHVVRLPLNTRFRGLTEREAMLIEGPYGWGEFAPFTEYDDEESARWLACAVEAAFWPPVAVHRTSVPVNATVPAVPADRVGAVLARFPGCTTAKVKVAESGQRLVDDVARLAEVRRALGPTGRVRVDANGAWDVDAAEQALVALAAFDLEYAEQPCATLPELVALRARLARRGLTVAIAVDESVRKAEDPLKVAVSGAADVVVIKVAPLGGVRAALDVAGRLGADHGLPVVVSSALDTSVGLAAGVRLAAALPELPFACGLGTAALLAGDVTSSPLVAHGGQVLVGPVPAEAELLHRHAADPVRRDWWHERLGRVHAVLTEQQQRSPH